MSKEFERILRESTEGERETVRLRRVVRKPTEIEELIKDGERPETVSIVETRMNDINEFFSGKLWNMTIEPTRGWVRYSDTEEILPDVYVDTQGYDYPRYMAVALSDADAWKDVLEDF